MENNVRQWDLSRKLKVGASITVGTNLMPEYVSTFLKIHPQSSIEVFIGSSDTIEKRILQNDLDFAFIEGTVHSDRIVSETYLKDRLAVICSPFDPLGKKETISIEQLLSRPLLLREEGIGTRELFDHVLYKLNNGTIIELQVEGLHFDRGLHIICHKNKLLTDFEKEFMEMCRNLDIHLIQ